jgi:tRNA(fMet)-specific endonuclease VapC
VVTTRYVLDTSTCIKIIRDHPVVSRPRIDGLTMGTVAMSVMTFGELRVSAERSARTSEWDALVDVLLVAIPAPDLTDDVDAHYGEIRAHLARTGQIIGSNDLWIGVHTRSVGATLMTSNVRGFMRIPDLRVENWASPDTLKGHAHAVHANPTHALSPTFALV